MNKTIFTSSVLISILCFTSHLNAGTLDFNTEADGTPYSGLGGFFSSTEYADMGVTLTTQIPGPGGTVVNVNQVNPANVGTSIEGYHINVGAAGDPTALNAVFSPEVFSVSFDWALPLASGIRVSAYDMSDTQIDQEVFLPTDTFLNQLGFVQQSGSAMITSDDPIHRITIEPVTQVSTIIVDNLSFVPEPSSLSLLGLSTLAFVRRRR